MLNLKLNVEKAFLNDVLVDRVANLALTEACDAGETNIGEGTAYAAQTAVGTFNVFNAGSSKNCAITAEGHTVGTAGANSPVLRGPSAITATLIATVVRRVHFAKGIAAVVTDIPWDKINAGSSQANHVNFVGKATSNWATEDGTTHNLTLTRADNTTDAVIEVVIDTVTVATGAGEDPNCNGKLYMKPIGEFHVDIVCEWSRIFGLKQNPIHFNVRARDPHVFAYTLETVPTPAKS